LCAGCAALLQSLHTLRVPELFGLDHGTPELERAAQELLQEARLLWVLRHPNIVRLHGVTMHPKDGHVEWIVTEFADGGSLESWLGARGRMTLEELLDLMRSIMRALVYLHRRTPLVIHRDIKPANVLVFTTPDGTIVWKLGDVGLAKVLQSTVHARTSAGTAMYAAPDVYTGPYDCTVDVFSTGIMAAELVVRYVDIPGFVRVADNVYTLPEHRPALVKDACARLDTVSPALSAVVRHCCAMSPAHRMSSDAARRALTGDVSGRSTDTAGWGAHRLVAAAQVANEVVAGVNGVVAFTFVRKMVARAKALSDSGLTSFLSAHPAVDLVQFESKWVPKSPSVIFADAELTLVGRVVLGLPVGPFTDSRQTLVDMVQGQLDSAPDLVAAIQQQPAVSIVSLRAAFQRSGGTIATITDKEARDAGAAAVEAMHRYSNAATAVSSVGQPLCAALALLTGVLSLHTPWSDLRRSSAVLLEVAARESLVRVAAPVRPAEGDDAQLARLVACCSAFFVAVDGADAAAARTAERRIALLAELERDLRALGRAERA
jgi:hypothetical protein